MENKYDNEKLKKIIKEMDNKEPVYAGCPNVGEPCFCTGICRKILSYKNKSIE